MTRSSPFLVALVAVVLVVAAAPRAADAWGGGRLFFSRTTRDAAPGADPEKAAAALAVTGRTAVPDAVDPNAAAAAEADSRPSTTSGGGGGGGRGYGLYGRPEENFPPSYFRRGVHRNVEKLTTTATTTTSVPGATTNVPTATTGAQEEAAPVEGMAGEQRPQPYPEDGSGRGRPPWYYTAFRGGMRPAEQEQGRQDFGMSDTRLYQNGRYYYDVDAGRYSYGRESNPMRTRPEPADEFGSGYGRAGAGDMRGRYGSAAGYRYGNSDGDRERDEFGSGAMVNNPSGGFPEEGPQNGRYIP